MVCQRSDQSDQSDQYTDYGAVPNDNVDDTGAINAAIQAGNTIYFPRGGYKYNGLMVLPDTANMDPNDRSYTLYGDGPGESIIIFTGAGSGISAPNIYEGTLTVEGLTLRANSAPSGTAISAYFSEAPTGFGGNASKFHTATIHNVQIGGTTRTGDTGGYWSRGIFLSRAQNAVIDKVEISGNTTDPGTATKTATGIQWVSPPGDFATTGIHITSTEIKYCDTGVKTSGWVEGFYMSGFEVVLCGRNGHPALDLTSSQSTRQGPEFHLINGHVDSIGDGIRMVNLASIHISNVGFGHSSSVATDGTHIFFDNCVRMTVAGCTFGGRANQYANENGIFLQNSKFAHIDGKYFYRNAADKFRQLHCCPSS